MGTACMRKVIALNGGGGAGGISPSFLGKEPDLGFRV